MTYTITQRNPNSWYQDKDGEKTFEVVASCGHKHRTLDSAIRCKKSLGNCALSRLGDIEDANGVKVASLDGGRLLHEAEQRVYESGR